jgi:hypothetical protein
MEEEFNKIPSSVLSEISREINKELQLNYDDCKHGYQGDCCCNCVNLVTINAHPGNETIGYGSILSVFGYGCKLQFPDNPKDQVPSIIFSERLHGMCEGHFRNIKKL